MSMCRVISYVFGRGCFLGRYDNTFMGDLENTEQSTSMANSILPRKRTGHSKYPLPTTQEKTLRMDITRWPTRNQIDYILFSQRWRSFTQSAKTRLETDCGSDHELLIAKFRLQLKKVGKTKRPSRYYLNQMLYDYRE